MKKCYDCKYASKVPGSTHFTCSKRAVLIGFNDYGRQSGWFNFPYDFDPIWLNECTVFFNKTDSIKNKGKEECFILIFNQFKIIKRMHEENILSNSLKIKIIELKLFERLKKIDELELDDLRDLTKLMIDL